MVFFAGLFYYNANSKHQLDKLEQGLAEVRSRARTQASNQRLLLCSALLMLWLGKCVRAL
jgi:hypothetical protein